MGAKRQPPGELIRGISFQYRRRGIWHYLRAGGVIVGLLLMVPALRLSQVGLLIYSGCLLAAYSLLQEGQRSMQRADHALASARAEAEVAAFVHLLTIQGWRVEHNLTLKRGNADVVLQSPQGNSFIVDVISDGGMIVVEQGNLKRRLGDRNYDFQAGDPLQAVNGQALEIQQIKQMEKATAILCFTQARVAFQDQPLQGVYVVSKRNLVDLLRKLNDEFRVAS
ncbi:MAG: NERD domain-containing protein [Oscillatoriales cyanobacterium RM2_1_1]|nr:NERD domain-containing protein [Oscillatoriales cyanobacterium RM2_1_1]